MDILRTPDSCFKNLEDFPFLPNYAAVDGLRVHYIDEGPRDASPVLLLHGEPSWSYLYRKMIPVLVAAGHRCIAPDLIGFGRSDKLANRADHSYQFHVDIMTAMVTLLDLKAITLFCQDWGGLIGLRVLADIPGRFARLVAANTGLPTGRQKMPEAFMKWRAFSQEVDIFPVGQILQGGCMAVLSEAVVAAYNAPFPDESFKEGPRVMPTLVPVTPTDPAATPNERAWEVLRAWEKPVLTAFSDGDPVTAGGDRVFQKQMRGAAGQSHVTITGAGHFLQEDKGEELAGVVNDFIAGTEG